MSYNYSFNDYEEDTTATRSDTNHNGTVFAFLGLVGELGEVVQALGLSQEDGLSPEEGMAVELLLKSQDLAALVEQHKKAVRKAQVQLLPNIVVEGSTWHSMVEEMGGVYWYLNNLAGNLEVTMQHVARVGVDTLNRRFAENPGWMTDDGPKAH